MKKKFLTFFVAVSMAFSLAACSSSNSTKSSDIQETDQTETVSSNSDDSVSEESQPNDTSDSEKNSSGDSQYSGFNNVNVEIADEETDESLSSDISMKHISGNIEDHSRKCVFSQLATLDEEGNLYFGSASDGKISLYRYSTDSGLIDISSFVYNIIDTNRYISCVDSEGNFFACEDGGYNPWHGTLASGVNMVNADISGDMIHMPIIKDGNYYTVSTANANNSIPVGADIIVNSTATQPLYFSEYTGLYGNFTTDDIADANLFLTIHQDGSIFDDYGTDHTSELEGKKPVSLQTFDGYSFVKTEDSTIYLIMPDRDCGFLRIDGLSENIEKAAVFETDENEDMLAQGKELVIKTASGYYSGKFTFDGGSPINISSNETYNEISDQIADFTASFVVLQDGTWLDNAEAWHY